MAIDVINWGYGSRAALKKVQAIEAERRLEEQRRLDFLHPRANDREREHDDTEQQRTPERPV